MAEEIAGGGFWWMKQGKFTPSAASLKRANAKRIKPFYDQSKKENIPSARDISALRKHNQEHLKAKDTRQLERSEAPEFFDRDQYEINRQKAIVDAAIDAEKKRRALEKTKSNTTKTKATKPKINDNFQEVSREPAYDDSHLARLDQEMAFSKFAQPLNGEILRSG